MSLTIKKCSKNWLKEALSVIQPTDGRQMLTLKEFITATDFAVDKWSMDKFFHNIKDDVPLYIDDETIKWFGYSGEIKFQKLQIREMLKNNFAEYKNTLWFEYSNKDYVKFYEKNPNTLRYPDPTNFKGKNKTNHMIVELNVFKMLIMLSNTKNKFRIMDYYITLEELVKKYFEYQVEQLKVSNFSLVYKLDQMQIKADEESKRQEDRFNKLIGVATDSKDQVAKMDSKLDKVMPNYVELDDLPAGDAPQVIIMRDRDAEPGELNLYIIRCQARDLNSRIKAEI